MDELFKLMKLLTIFNGVDYVTMSSIYAHFGTRSTRVKRIVKTAVELGLVKEHKVGRSRYSFYTLTDKGRRVLKYFNEIYSIVYGSQISRAERVEKSVGEEFGEDLPEFLTGNPWLEVLSKRGRE
ncbi:MAG: hypothetical protein DRJ52_10320 [Thermoprotei archaeon]|nr:MAG: hypothetical protein DRJ52_10320 [Thermoprotei archaeon]